MLNRRLVGVAAGVLTAVGAAAWFMGCSATIGGGGGGNAGLRLSASKLNPGQFLTVFHSSSAAGSTVAVKFAGPGGFDVEVETILTDNGSARIAVPPLIDMQTGEFLEGEMQVSLPELSGGSVALTVQALPQINSPSPGALLREVLLMSLEVADAAEAKAATIAADLPDAVESPSDLEFFTQQRTAVAGILEELDTTGQLTIEAANGTIVTLTAQDLALGDRLLASYLVGIIDETGGDSSVALKTATRLKGEGESTLDFEALKEEFRRVANNIVNGGGAFLGAATLIVAGGGLLLSGLGPVAVVGGIVLTVGGAVWAIGSSSIANRIGSFFDEKLGELYNVGETAFSGAVSVGTEALGTLKGKWGQLFSGVSTLRTAQSTYENFTRLECETNPAPGPEPGQKRGSANHRADSFCIIVLPDVDVQPTDPDCSDDGICNAECPIDPADPDCDDGTGNGTEPGPSAAFTILGFANTDGAIGSGPSLDPSAAQIQLSGDPSRPTISWSGLSGVFSLMVTTSSGFFAEALYGIEGRTPPDENGDTEQVPFGFSSVTYGTFGLTNTVPLDGPSGPLGPADAIPLSPGMLVSVSVFTLNAEIATLTFQVN